MSNILYRANQIVNERSEEKERQYGDFAKCMSRATAIYNLLSESPQAKMTPIDMYKAMIAMKLAREAHAHKEDNLLDAAAYIGAMNNHIEEYVTLSNKQE